MNAGPCAWGAGKEAPVFVVKSLWQLCPIVWLIWLLFLTLTGDARVLIWGAFVAFPAAAVLIFLVARSRSHARAPLPRDLASRQREALDVFRRTARPLTAREVSDALGADDLKEAYLPLQSLVGRGLLEVFDPEAPPRRWRLTPLGAGAR